MLRDMGKWRTVHVLAKRVFCIPYQKRRKQPRLLNNLEWEEDDSDDDECAFIIYSSKPSMCNYTVHVLYLRHTCAI